MWFGVSLLLCGETPSRKTSDLVWEENIVLVEAASCDEAKLLGANIGKGMEVEYDSASGEHIHWTFRNVTQVYEIQEQMILRTGAEVFSRFLRNSEAESLTTPFYEDEASKTKEH
jgi:hypothetical protein